MLKRISLVLIAVLMIGSISIAQTQAQFPCDFVERFMIMNRPTQIELSDVDLIAELTGYGATSEQSLRDEINLNGPITNYQTLVDLDGIGTSKADTITIFFELEGKEDCPVPMKNDDDDENDDGNDNNGEDDGED